MNTYLPMSAIIVCLSATAAVSSREADAETGFSFEQRDESLLIRWGKFLFVELDKGPWLVMHFGMTGYVDYSDISEELPDHTRVTCQFEGDRRLAYVCQRKLGCVSLADDVESFVQLRNMGPDGLNEQLDFEAFRQCLAGRTAHFCPRCQQ